MKLLKVLALRGPNIWANFPVLEAYLDLEELQESPSNELPGFNERLMSWLPSMIEHRCSIGERGGFFERLRRGTYPAHIVEHITLELQSLAGVPAGFGKARETSNPAVYRVIVEFEEEEFAKAALNTAIELYLAAVHDKPFDVAGEIAKLTHLAHDVRLGPSTRAIVNAAIARKIPTMRLNDGSLVQLGYGARNRKILTAETDATSSIAGEIAQDKQLTRRLLKAVGVPTPDGRAVDGEEDAWDAAREIGGPVVVKPQFGNQGKGVAVNLTTKEQVVAAYQNALEYESTVVVERYVEGYDWRLLVVNEKLVAASRREPPKVTGDGIHTIAQLVEEINKDPRRSDGHSTSLTFISLDAIALSVLSEQGYQPDSIPPAGKEVLIRRNANLSTGGTAEDVTGRVHPQVAARMVDAARAIGLDIAGVDVVAKDIAVPLEEQGGAVVEVNARPGLRMHLEPSAGTAQPVGEAIINMLFPDGEDGRIPVVSVSGVNGKTTTTRLIAHILSGTGVRVGMTCTDGIYVDQRRIDQGDCSGPKSAKSLLLNPMVEAAVFETARGGILREGMGYDHCCVAVVTNIGEGDHLGLGEVTTLEDLAKVKRCVVDVVLPSGYAVLNAADPYVAEMAPYSKGKVIFFAIDGQLPVMVKHRQENGRVVFVQNNQIMMSDGPGKEFALVPLSRVPLTHHGRIRFHVENVLAATAAAWGLGIEGDVIRTRLESFFSDMDAAPGRFNILEIKGATVVVDYGHNVSALQAVIDAIRPFPHEKRLAVYSAAGDRRDSDMVQ
ncbi:MAG: cyanophycin synthetase, partial [Magnetococcales bacterium]|nr:cyanophycin synthetase [Magnetococcales bacterium]